MNLLPATTQKKITKADRRRAAGDLVLRARAGDQVAMGVIAEVHRGAQAGDPSLIAAAKLLKEYIKKNPPGEIGYERGPKSTFWSRVVEFVHGPALFAPGNESMRLVGSVVDTPIERKSLITGLEYWNQKRPRGVDPMAWSIGRMLGLARTIQLVREPDVSLALLCPVVAWELE